MLARAKEPFLDWLRSLPDPTEITLEEINRECTAYLVPEYDLDSDVPLIVRDVFQTVFQIELESWWLDESDWPDTSDFVLFNSWFAVEVHSVTRDLTPGPIEFDDV